MDSFLKTFHVRNAARCEEAFQGFEAWSETDWGCALAGEVGELCNLLKKRKRDEDIPLEKVGDEIADVFIYLDLLCTKLGLDPEELIRHKFNIVSERVASAYRL